MPGALHILVTSYFGYLGRPKSSSMFVYLLILQGKTGKSEIKKNKQNHATKVTKIQKNEVTKMK